MVNNLPFGINVKSKLDTYVFYSIKLRFNVNNISKVQLTTINKLGFRIIERNKYVFITLLSYRDPISETTINNLKQCLNIQNKI